MVTILVLTCSCWSPLADDRFGQRDRPAAECRNTPAHITTEINAIWPNLRSGSKRYFAAAYLIERHREAVLWTFFVQLGDTDKSGSYSHEERQTMLRQLKGRIDGDQLHLQDCNVGLPDCFGGIDYFDYDGPEDQLLEPVNTFAWVAFAENKCTQCLYKALIASGAPYNTSSSNLPLLDCVRGGKEASWEEIEYDWPECGAGSNNITREQMAKGLIGRYSYSLAR